MPESPPMQPDSDAGFAGYRVERAADGSLWKLGSGAMGVTYKAYDERLRVFVALKVITPALVDDAKTQALFLREARAAARVRHGNVASVLALNDTPGNFFYAMEFIAGESLADWLRTRGAMPPAMAIEFATQIARGLEAIHAQQIVHRDLKPANLMIVPTGRIKPGTSAEANPDAWQIKIIDFGLARAFAGEGLGTEINAPTIGFRGTALYASPEQCEEHGEIDGRSDLYSLGCILWEMLLGSPPFRARTHRELLNKHVAQSAPLERIAHLPDGLQAVLSRLLEKDPAHRLVHADGRVDEVGVTTREAEPVADPAPVPLSSRSWSVAVTLASATLLAIGAVWFFSRDQATAPVAAVTTPAATPAVLSRKSIAVLPFENLSGRPEDAYLADGLQEEILNALARLRDLKVISRTSAKEYRGKDLNIREIGQRLGVGTVIEGSVRREGNTLRLTIQVIDARDDH